MPSLLGGQVSRSGGSGQFITLSQAQPQLPASPTTATGFTVVTNPQLVTSYASSLGYLQFTTGTISNQIPGNNIVLQATGTATVVVSGVVQSTDPTTGALTVAGGLGVVGNINTARDIHANGITLGRGYSGNVNNITIKGSVQPATDDDYPTGHDNISIGFDSLNNMQLSVKSIAIGRLALSSGTNIINSIAIGDSALQYVGIQGSEYIGTVTNAIYNGYDYTTAGSYSVFTAVVNARSNVLNVTSITTGVITLGSVCFTTNGISTPIDGYTITGLGTGNGGTGTYILNALSLSTATIQTSAGATIVGLTSSTILYPSLPQGQGVITLPNHGLTSGTAITIAYFTEPQTTEYIPGNPALDQSYFVGVVDANTLALYSDAILSQPDLVDDDVPYFIGAPVYLTNDAQKNIAIGSYAGQRLQTGRQNFFIGDNAASHFTTGSFNFFIGADVAQNMTYGNGIIGIGSQNLVDGVDNQINIGSVFYYDGMGYLQLNADVGLGLGDASTSTDSGGLAVYGGLGVSENIIVGSTVDSTATTNGAVTIAGGVGIGKSVFIGGGLDVSKGNKNVNLSPVGGNVLIEPTIGGSLTIYPNAVGGVDNVNIGIIKPATGNFTSVHVVGTATSTSTNTGALTVVGGVGIAGNMFIAGGITGVITTATNIAGGARGSIPYQNTAGSTTLLPIGINSNILVSNGSTPYWTDVNSLLSNTTTNASKIFVTTATTGTYFLGLTENIGSYSPVDSTSTLAYYGLTGQLAIGSTTVSTSTNTGALTVAGGVGVAGSVYSADGGQYENNLLYVPRVIVSTSTPFTARIGDFWVEPNTGIEFQYIQDGTNRIWIQFAGL